MTPAPFHATGARGDPRDEDQQRLRAKPSQEELDAGLAEIADSGQLCQILRLLAQGANPKAKPAIGAWRSTALIRSARNPRAECMRALLPLSDPLAADQSGNTALILAAHWGRSEHVRLLLPHCDLGAKAGDGMGALECARAQGRDDIALMILAEQARREAKAIAEASGPAAAAPKAPL